MFEMYPFQKKIWSPVIVSIMHLCWRTTSAIALLAAMHNNSGGDSDDSGQKRALEVVDDAVEPSADAIYSWMLAVWQTNDIGPAWHATQGADLRTNLIERLLRGDYTRLKNELSSMNLTAFNALIAVCTSKTRMFSEMRGGTISEHRNSTMEMLLCAQVRLHTTTSTSVYLSPAVALSMLAVRNGPDKTFSTILSSMRLVYRYSFSHDLAIELSERTRVESVVQRISSIAFAAADNKGYYIKTNEKHGE